MPAVKSVLVVGAGAAGTAVAIPLARAGVAVTLVEVKPDVTALGSGITLQGNALRVMRDLGVYDRARELGYPFSSLGVRAPDPAGTLVAEIPDAPLGGPDLPTTMGMYRPDLARILVERAREVGVDLRFDTSVSRLTDTGDWVDVELSDGSTGTYDLVIGADGIRSSIRSMIGIDPQTRRVGMGILRAFTERPQSVTRTDLIYGGPSYIAGYCPTGENSLYCYIVEPLQDRQGQSQVELLDALVEKSRAYHGPWDDIRPLITDPSRVFYTAFETHFVPMPWNRGRVTIIGDAAHTCPPTLAQGAAMAFEDGIVLAELLVTGEVLDDALWDSFAQRRAERARTVIDASNQLAQWQLDHVQGDIPEVMGRLVRAVMPPA